MTLSAPVFTATADQRFPGRTLPRLVPVLLLACTALFGEPAAGEDTQVPTDYWALPVPAQGPLPASAPAVQLVTGLDPGACGQCHPRQFEEWRESFHARAVGPGLIGQLPLFDEDTTRSCLDCHAPRAEQQLDLIENGSPVHGVDCAACHVRAHRRHGPRAIATTPHGPVRAEPLFQQSEFCAPCHQFGEDGIRVAGTPLENTLEEWKASRYPASGDTCQGCHMRDGSHRFTGIHDPATVREALTVRARRTAAGVSVELENRGAGHALPTYITPRIEVLWRGDDGSTQQIAVLQRQMDWDDDHGWSQRFDTRLQAHERRRLSLALPAGAGGRVEVRVEPDADYRDRVYPAMLEVMQELPEDQRSHATALIERARAAAGASSYRLLQLHCPEHSGSDCH